MSYILSRLCVSSPLCLSRAVLHDIYWVCASRWRQTNDKLNYLFPPHVEKSSNMGKWSKIMSFTLTNIELEFSVGVMGSHHIIWCGNIQVDRKGGLWIQVFRLKLDFCEFAFRAATIAEVYLHTFILKHLLNKKLLWYTCCIESSYI